MLFKTLNSKTIEEQISEFIPITTFGSSYSLIKADFEMAESIFIPKILDSTTYAALASQYESETLSANNKTLLKLCQGAIANLGYVSYIPKAQVKQSDAGIHIMVTGTEKTAFQWQINELKISYLESGFYYLDEALKFLWTNKATYTDWANSSINSKFNKLFISNVSEFQEIIDIKNSGRMLMRLVPFMEKIEEFHIKHTIGSALYNNIKSRKVAGTLNSEDNAILPTIRRIVANLSMAEALPKLIQDVSADGVSLISYARGEQNYIEKTPATEDRLLKLASDYRVEGVKYLKELKTFLNTNASAVAYADYFTSDMYEDPTAEKVSINKDSKSFTF